MRSYLSIIYRKRQSNRLSQEGGTFACKHCPFLTRRHDYLARHERHHSANHPFQCNFCTFSSKSLDNLVGHHINRVHLEELKVKVLLTNRHFISHLGLLLIYRINNIFIHYTFIGKWLFGSASRWQRGDACGTYRRRAAWEPFTPQESSTWKWYPQNCCWNGNGRHQSSLLIFQCLRL